jgi:predicted O-methyltransferase YrrM
MKAKYETAVLQDQQEIELFAKFALCQGVKSYLEIGSKHGGSLWRMARALPSGSKVVSVDLPRGDGSFKESQVSLESCVEELRRRGYKAQLFIGDSTDGKMVEQVRKFAPFDLCLIDADHTEKFLLRDWANYGPMARIVAFHDISWIPKPDRGKKKPIEVPKVWNELKARHRHIEIKKSKGENGIGILWRA